MSTIEKLNVSLKDIISKYILNDGVFGMVLLLMTFITSVPYLNYQVREYYKYILFYGLLIVLWKLFTGKLFPLLKSPINVVAIGFLGSYLISVFLNRDAMLVDNIKQLAYMGVFVVLLFITVQDLTLAELKHRITVFSGVIVLLTFLLSYVSYEMYEADFCFYYVLDNVKHTIGYNWIGLYGFYNLNTCGAYCAISIILSLGFIIDAFMDKYVKLYNGVIRAILVLFSVYNIDLQFRCLALTNSRTSEYALYIILAIACVLLPLIIINNRFKDKGEMFVFATPALMYVMPDDGSGVDTFIDLIEKITGDLSGRDTMWMQGLNVFSSRPIFGVTQLRIGEAADRIATEIGLSIGIIDLSGGGIHNAYITVLAASGLIGFIIFIALMLAGVLKALRAGMKATNTDVWFVISFLMVLMFLITEFFEARIIYTVNVFNVMFWLYFGFTVSYSNSLLKSRKAD